jgi:hypothetical protein
LIWLGGRLGCLVGACVTLFVTVPSTTAPFLGRQGNCEQQ